MNLASWIILAIVVAALVLAVRATFFKKERRGGCCDVGDTVRGAELGKNGRGCNACVACDGCAGSTHCLQPTIKMIDVQAEDADARAEDR